MIPQLWPLSHLISLGLGIARDKKKKEYHQDVHPGLVLTTQRRREEIFPSNLVNPLPRGIRMHKGLGSSDAAFVRSPQRQQLANILDRDPA
jgi:hypothetical protein